MKRRILVLGVVWAALAHGCTIAQTGLSVDDSAGMNAGGGFGDGGAGAAPVAGSGVGGAAGTDSGVAATGGTSIGGTGGTARDAAVSPDAPVLPCVGATGTGKAPGAACACNGECAGNFCVDGVCCEEACAGPCRSCALTGSKGRCVFSPAAQKDDRNMCAVQATNTCGTSGMCDGQGGCAKHPAGTGCGSAADCQSGIYKGPSTCDGKGVCTPGPTVPCNPFTCGVGACLSRCETTKDCAAGLMCNNGLCEGPRSLGATCSAASQCGSGFCVDGVCCSEACAGQCRSCALPSSRGQCQLIPSGQMAIRGECPAQAASTCGRNGTCDGQGSCKVYPVDTTCAAASCMSGTQREVSLCNGAGTCAAGTSRNCSPYVCGGAGTCLTSCSGDKGCVEGTICVLGACGSYPILDIPFTLLAPVTDGAIDAVWAAATPAQNIAKVLVGQATNDFTATFRALWSQAGLHLLVLVQDTKRVNDSTGEGSYDDDTVEVYLDADGSRGTSLDGVNDHHMLFGWSDKNPQNVSLRRTEGIGFAQAEAAAGYSIELLLPWTTLGGGAATSGKIIGLDVHVNDDDDGGLRDRKLAWFATQDVSYRDPSSYARVRLK